MANNEKGNPPTAMNSKIVKNLLDQLSTNNEFRQLFQRDARAALEQVGYEAPADSSRHSGDCLQLLKGASLAPADKIMRERAKLEASLNAVQDFLCPMDLQAD